MEDDYRYEFLLACLGCGKPIVNEPTNVVFEGGQAGVPLEFDIVHKACDRGSNDYIGSIELVTLVAALASRHLTPAQLRGLANL